MKRLSYLTRVAHSQSRRRNLGLMFVLAASLSAQAQQPGSSITPKATTAATPAPSQQATASPQATPFTQPTAPGPGPITSVTPAPFAAPSPVVSLTTNVGDGLLTIEEALRLASAFDQERRLAFSSHGDGTLTVVQEDSPDKFRVVENVATQRGARTIELDQKGHRVFVVTAEFGSTPAATAETPRPRPKLIPGSFTLLVFGK